MLGNMSTANVITLSRLPLLVLIVILLYHPQAWSLFGALLLLPVLYLMDWLDGYVARYRDEVTELGGVLDIAIDRVVENVLWIVFAHLDKVGIWVPILFIVRSFVVDGLRSFALAKGKSAFGMMHSWWGRFLVASRTVRGLYGLSKGLAFGTLALSSAVASLGPQAQANAPWLPGAEVFLVYLSVVLCVVRGVPVFWDIRSLIRPPDPSGSS